MKNFWLCFFLPFYLIGQERLPSLKETLNEAGQAYDVIFTFDDDRVSNFIASTTPLPKTLEAFISQLKNEYHLVSTFQNKAIILAPDPAVKMRSFCGSIESDLITDALDQTWVIIGKQFTQTKSDGSFSFDTVDGKASTIQFKNSALGTVERPITFDNENCEAFFLDYSEIHLGEVIVNYISPPIEKNSNGVFKINLDTALTSPGSIQPDIFEIVQLLPGITSPNEDNALYVRGSTPDQNNILWNDIRIYQNNHANGGLSSLNPYGIKSADVMIKGVPVSFGDHTAGLVLLDNYQNPKQQGWKGSYGIGLLDTDLALHYSEKDQFQSHISLRSSFNNTLSKTFKTNTFNRLISPTTNYESVNEQTLYYNDFTFSTRILLNAENSMSLQGFYLHDQMGYELTLDDFEYKDFLNAQNFGFGMVWDQFQNSWKHRYHFSYTNFEMLFNRSLYQFQYDQEEEEYETEHSNLNQRENHIKEAFFKTIHQKNYLKKYVFYWGTDVVHRTVSLNNNNTINDQERLLAKTLTGFNGAVFTGWKATFSNKNHLETGLRYNYFQTVNQLRLEPRINFTHFFNSHWSTNATFESKSQSVYRTNETINFASNQSYNLWSGSEGNLYPLLTSKQGTIGLTRKDDNTIVEADVYQKEIQGITTFNFGYIDPNDQDFHIGNAKVFGVDFFFQRKWNHANFWTSYTYQDNINRFDDLKSGQWFNSNFLVKHQLNIGTNYSNKNWNLALNYVLRSGIPYSKPTGVNWIEKAYVFQYAVLNDQFLPQFNRLDMSLSKRVIFGDHFKMDFKVAFKNITNSKNVLERIFLYDQASMEIKSVDRFSLEPFFNIGVRFFMD